MSRPRALPGVDLIGCLALALICVGAWAVVLAIVLGVLWLVRG